MIYIYIYILFFLLTFIDILYFLTLPNLKHGINLNLNKTCFSVTLVENMKTSTSAATTLPEDQDMISVKQNDYIETLWSVNEGQ